MHKVFISYHHANDQWCKNALMPESDLTGRNRNPRTSYLLRSFGRKHRNRDRPGPTGLNATSVPA